MLNPKDRAPMPKVTGMLSLKSALSWEGFLDPEAKTKLKSKEKKFFQKTAKKFHCTDSNSYHHQ